MKLHENAATESPVVGRTDSETGMTNFFSILLMRLK